LSINAFNPGRATVLAQALVLLQKQESFPQLRYDVRLFVPDPSMPRVGEAIESLLSPGTTVSTEAADAFSFPGGSHLFPKLSLAIHALHAFNDDPQRYRAHLSMLFDLFPAEEIGAGPAFREMEMTPLYGLAQDFITDFQDNEDGTFWRRQPRHGRAYQLTGTEISIDLLADLARAISGNVADEQRPIVTLSLSTGQRELIHYVHEISDWVLTIDRNIGIEFFDHGGRLDRPDYLIDYTPGSSTGFGHQLVITSRALLELEATLKPVLLQHGLKASRHETNLILDQLRALSGRLALKLISSSTHQAEALGLALARLFLLQQGALANQILLPLDVHLDLFRTLKQARDELGEAITLQRTDLALFDLNAATRTICCNLVEVKCYNSVGAPSAYAQLKETITQQINQSENVLSHHFDPQWKIPDRPDRLLRDFRKLSYPREMVRVPRSFAKRRTGNATASYF
jgi:DNA phosphorothioation-dependent restriction protein DptH